jgi:hypothetical protein
MDGEKRIFLCRMNVSRWLQFISHWFAFQKFILYSFIHFSRNARRQMRFVSNWNKWRFDCQLITH